MGETHDVTISASDADGDPLSFSSIFLPSFASLRDNGDGTATLRLAPTLFDVGSYPGVVLNVSDGIGFDSETITITVTGPPALRVADVGHVEGDSGTTAYDFVVSLSRASTQVVSVDYATVDGSATVADSDYQFATDSVSFTPGQTSRTVTVLVNGDTRVEPDESFTLHLANAINASLADADGTGTIQNDDVNHPPVLAPVGDQTVEPGEVKIVTVSATDADGDPIVAERDQLPAVCQLRR